MEDRQSTVVQRAFTSVTETVFPGSRSLKHIPRETVLGTGTNIIKVNSNIKGYIRNLDRIKHNNKNWRAKVSVSSKFCYL